MKKISLLKSIYTKQALLYSLNLYFDDVEFKITDDEQNYIIEFKDISDENFKFIQQEINFNCLRFEIADNNKELRSAIISQALGSINVD